MKKIILPVVVLVIAVCFAFGADYLFYAVSDRTGTEVKGSVIFTDGHETLWVSGCEIADGKVIITGGDPQFALAATDEEVSAVRISFIEPVAQDTSFQMFFTRPGEGLSEESSVHGIIYAGEMEKRITLSPAVYSLFRFDIEQNVHIREIVSGNEIPIAYAYYPNVLRVILLAAELFALVFGLRFLMRRRKEETVFSEKSVRKKPVFAVAACNLFLALTVVLFQPLTYARAFMPGSVTNAWWIYLLVAAGAAAVLSCLMVFLPERVCNVLAALSLGVGVAFLTQSLFLNPNRVLRMDTSFPIVMLNIFVWFGIVILSVVIAAYYTGEQQRAILKVMCVIAAVLMAVQAMDFTILVTKREGDPLPKGYAAQENYTHSEKYGFGDLMEVSRKIGMPYYLK